MDEPKPQVIVMIRKDGHATVRVLGVQGRDCVQKAKWIEDALGVVEERIFTGEYYEHPDEAKDDTSAAGRDRDRRPRARRDRLAHRPPYRRR